MDKLNKDLKINLIKSKIEHEDILICNRLNWLWAINGGLIVAYYSNVLNDKEWLLVVIGIITNLSIGFHLITGEICLRRIRKTYKENCTYSTEESMLIIGYDIIKQKHSHWLILLLPTYINPILFLIFWIIVAF